MTYRINNCNENYLMINQFNLFSTLINLQEKQEKTREEQKIEIKLQQALNTMITYKNNNNRRVIIEELAIDINSKIGQYIIKTEEEQRTTIQLNEIINALIACIEKKEWEHYNELNTIIKCYYQNNTSIDYIKFKNKHGQKITNYIIKNSKRIPKTYSSLYTNQIIYLYENNKIIKIDLNEKINIKTKRKIK